MTRSTGGEQSPSGVTSSDLLPFEGLVHSTARMFAQQVGREEDDLAQELRIIVWRAVMKYNPRRSSLSIERYVFGSLTNKMKDYKRDAVREVNRRDRHGVSFLHIEDMRTGDDETGNRQESFDSRYNFVTRDEVYQAIDDGKLTLPAGVTQREASVLLLLMMELSKTEIVLRLSLTRAEVYECIASLRLKFADWKPSDSSRTVRLSTVPTVRVGAELVGSRAA